MADLKFPDGYYFTETDEWIKIDGDVVTLGISDYAQEQLNDIVYVELAAVGDTLDAGDSFGSVESVKAASDLYTPVGGEVIETNSLLEDEPETINADAFGKGWMLKLRVASAPDTSELMDSAAYKKFCDER
ncbi:MAG TPA: glycine cleavage system protein GcvH [Aggregatilineales bacterium]|jgi:glycine cleavage system H protein|nr:glycine cleavage system protein GcvH [Aggregatilineales bacterium]